MDFDEQLRVQGARMMAFQQDDYELDQWEGFTCSECGWRGLAAPSIDPEDRDIGSGMIVECAECGEASPSTSDEETDWEKVREKVPDEYFDR